MILILGNWKRKVLKFIGVLALLLAFVMAVPALTGILVNQVPAFSGWFRDEQPTGNPMRVENEEQTSNFDQVLDQFVIKLQDFYQEE